jgi:hypothetical protein
MGCAKIHKSKSFLDKRDASIAHFTSFFLRHHFGY